MSKNYIFFMMLMLVVMWLGAVGGPVATTEEEVDYYGELELPKGEDSTERDIKQQFRILSKKFHPDLNPTEEGRLRYQKIQRAHEVLSDRKKRKMYDMKGEAGVKQLEKGNAGGGQMDPLAAFFGGGHGGDGGNRGGNAELKFEVSLEDVYNGNVHMINIKKQKLCRKCKGSGAHSKKDMSTCKHCKGQGVIMQRVQMGPFVQQVQQQCPHCQGKGKTVTKKCELCGGKKVMRGDQELHLDIEKGMPEEHKIIFEMESDQNPDQIPGDVIFTVKTKPHKRFRRKGNDLYYTLKVSLVEALVGFEKSISHLDGHEVVVTRSIVTPFGTVIKLEEEGMPVHNVPSEKGVLFVTIEVEFPKMVKSSNVEPLRSLLKKIDDNI